MDDAASRAIYEGESVESGWQCTCMLLAVFANV